MDAATRRALEEALEARVLQATPLSGGDINEAYRLELSDGRRVFAKTRRPAPEGMFPAEAAGLEWLRSAFGNDDADSLTIPRVLACSDDHRGAAFLVLELLEPGPRRADFDERLGRGLAKLHRSGAPGFGFHHDNFIGLLPQSNRPAPTWAEFYRSERLERQLALPEARTLIPSALRRRIDTLLARLEQWTGPEEPPARLHGDLWGGNLHGTADGRPALIDPAAYGGHREMDLSMMKLFGGFSARTFAAYEEAYPLTPGHERRIALWQMYPILVHVNLFGAGYVGQLARLVDHYVDG